MSLARREDYAVVTIVGLVFGLALIPIFANIDPGWWRTTVLNSLLIIAGTIAFANFALWTGSVLGSRFLFLWQFAKFGAVGSMNAALDLGIVNLLSFIFKAYSGWQLVIFNVAALSVALTNSYLLNKLWSFKSAVPVQFKELIGFVAVSLTTVLINTALVYVLTTTIGAPSSISAPLWENIVKLIAVPITLIINFLGYKFLVFKI